MYCTGTQMKYRGVEQLEARRAHNPEVAGSSPAPATTNRVFCEYPVFLRLAGKEIIGLFIDL